MSNIQNSPYHPVSELFAQFDVAEQNNDISTMLDLQSSINALLPRFYNNATLSKTQAALEQRVAAVLNPSSFVSKSLIKKFAKASAAQDIDTMLNIQEVFTQSFPLAKKTQARIAEAISDFFIDSSANPPLETQGLSSAKPIGLVNTGRNLCYVNAALQFLAGIGQKMIKNEKNVFSPVLKQYLEAQASQTPQLDIGDELRKAYNLNKTSTQSFFNPGEMEDAIGVIEDALNSAGLENTLEIRIENQAGKKVSTQTSQEAATLIRVHPDNKGNHFTNLLEEFFQPENDVCVLNKGENNEKTRRVISQRFKETPSDLFINVVSSTQTTPTLKDTPELYTLPKKYSATKPATYMLQTVLIKTDGMHYIAVKKVGNTWYLADDSKVSKLTSQEAHTYINKGVLFHYAQVEEAVVDNKTLSQPQSPSPKVEPTPPSLKRKRSSSFFVGNRFNLF